jgi:hypothetical protein
VVSQNVNMAMRITVALLCLPGMLSAQAQAGSMCSDRVSVNWSNCSDPILDTAWLKHVLKPNDVPRRVDEDCVLIPNTNRLHLSLLSGFEGPISVLIADSVLFKGIVHEDHSTSVSLSLNGKQLRIETEGHCMSTMLLGEYPALDIHYISRKRLWVVNYRDWIMDLR